MKKILFAIFALAGLCFTSCTQEHFSARLNPDQFTDQVLGNVTGCALAEDGANITVTYSEAEFGVNIADPVYTFFVFAQGDAIETATKLDATIGGGNISFTQKKLNSAILNMGYGPNEEVGVSFLLTAAPATDKGKAIDKYTITSNVVNATFVTYEKILGPVDVVDVPGDYQGWAPASYPKLFNYSYDETNYRGVIDFQCTKEDGSAANGFKVTYGGDWSSDTGNWGSESQAEAPEATAVQLINGDASKNIMCYGANRFYLFNFNKSSLTLTKIYGFNKVGVIGLGGMWGDADDVVMNFNMYYDRFWVDVDVAEDTEFKFRLDGGWDNNWGGDLEALSGGGANIPIASGQYRIYFYMGHEPMTAEIDAAMYGQPEPDLKPEPVPVTYQGWGIIGVGGDWEKDIEMTEASGVWTGYASIAASDQFKLRKDAAWDENRGAPGDVEPYVVTPGTPVAATAGGKNMSVPADGFYKIVYNVADETITVTDGTVWGVIGDFNEWAGDVFMANEGGVWTSPAIELAAGKGFKIRKNSGWDDNRGIDGEGDAVEIALGTATPAVAGGKNITVPSDGKYIVIYDSAAETITVNKALPDNTWSLIGVNGDWDNDIFMSEVMPGIWVSPATAMSGEFKIRFNHDWGVNRGCDPLKLGGPGQQALQDGPNIKVEEGTYIVVYDSEHEIIYLQGWSLIGTVNGSSWNIDYPLMPIDVEDGDVAWTSYAFYVEDAGEFKIRYNAGWDVNKGGVFADFCTPFAAVDGGDNVKIGKAGYYFVAFNPDSNELAVGRADWGVIGDFNGWAGDVVMFEGEKGIYTTLEPVALEAGKGFKIRKDRGWDTNRGAVDGTEPVEVTPDTPIAVNNNGKNLTVPATGDYVIMYDSNNETITVTAAN